MNRILIVDDEQLKADYLALFIKENCYECQIFFAISYDMAMANLGKKYDLVICDNFLDKAPPHDGKKYGYHFIQYYEKQWPDATCLLYTAYPELVPEAEQVNEEDYSVVNGHKIYTYDGVQTEVLLKMGKVCNRQLSNLENEQQPESEEVKPTMKNYVQFASIGITLVGVAVGIGVAKNELDTTRQNLSSHCTNQKYRDEKIDDALTKLALNVERLSVTNEQLSETVKELKTEIRRAR